MSPVHLKWCKQRVCALIELMQGGAGVGLPATADIESALDQLAAKEIIWHGLGFSFEEQRYASWILDMDPATDFHVERDGGTVTPCERPGLIVPAVLS